MFYNGTVVNPKDPTLGNLQGTITYICNTDTTSFSTSGSSITGAYPTYSECLNNILVSDDDTIPIITTPTIEGECPNKSLVALGLNSLPSFAIPYLYNESSLTVNSTTCNSFDLPVDYDNYNSLICNNGITSNSDNPFYNLCHYNTSTGKCENSTITGSDKCKAHWGTFASSDDMIIPIRIPMGNDIYNIQQAFSLSILLR